MSEKKITLTEGGMKEVLNCAVRFGGTWGVKNRDKMVDRLYRMAVKRSCEAEYIRIADLKAREMKTADDHEKILHDAKKKVFGFRARSDRNRLIEEIACEIDAYDLGYDVPIRCNFTETRDLLSKLPDSKIDCLYKDLKCKEPRPGTFAQCEKSLS